MMAPQGGMSTPIFDQLLREMADGDPAATPPNPPAEPDQAQPAMSATLPARRLPVHDEPVQSGGD
ncbi:MAG: hypothetical protein ACJ72N_12295 [Labedaea sp.]